ncbi:MAG: hypothetical protein LBP33_06700 [Candidatus Adiutrix sp.]|jgi:hypothetical protein|nr:hypothetical protein [Candidatus Adiutrix sp.]
MRTERQAGRRLAPLILVLSAALLLSACGRTDLGYRAPTEVDVIDRRGRASLPFDVTEFSWRYLPDGRRIELTGTIRNNGRAPQGGFVYALMFDEDGLGTAMGEGAITPALVRPGADGQFTIVAQTNRPRSVRPLKAIRLLTNTQKD